MKKNILTGFVLAMSMFSSAQFNKLHHEFTANTNVNTNSALNNKCWLAKDSTIVKSRQYYLELSKKNRNTGFCFLGAGCAMIATGFLIGNRNNSTFNEAGIGIIIGGSGVLFALGSIPFFISSAICKQKAELAISIHPGPSIATSSAIKNIAGILFKIPFH